MNVNSPETFSKVNEEVTANLVRAGFKYTILMGDHGGGADTSETWSVGSRYVRPDKIATGDPVNRGPNGAVIGPSGVEGDPRRSSPALGKMFADIKVKDGVGEIRRLVSASAGS